MLGSEGLNGFLIFHMSQILIAFVLCLLEARFINHCDGTNLTYIWENGLDILVISMHEQG